jgi:RNA polymerase-binding transcription factor DksA
MTIYNYSQNRHSDPVDASANLTQRLNDLHVRSARAQAANLLEAQGTQLCVDCDDEIGAERKEAVPSATRCAPCQGDHDHLTLLISQGGRPD